MDVASRHANDRRRPLDVQVREVAVVQVQEPGRREIAVDRLVGCVFLNPLAAVGQAIDSTALVPEELADKMPGPERAYGPPPRGPYCVSGLMSRCFGFTVFWRLRASGYGLYEDTGGTASRGGSLLKPHLLLQSTMQSID
jgi:hypothetical protein